MDEFVGGFRGEMFRLTPVGISTVAVLLATSTALGFGQLCNCNYDADYDRNDFEKSGLPHCGRSFM